MTPEVNKLKSTNKALLIIVIIFSFFLGYLTNKVAVLEKNGSANPIETVKGAAINPTEALRQAKVKPVTASDHIRGDKNGKVTLVVYSDFECPFCQKFHPTTKELLKIYGDRIRLVYRHFPLSFHQNAQKEAEASECIAELGGNDSFWNYIDAIFERTTANGTGFALEKLGPLAGELGVNQGMFQTCLNSGKYEKLIKEQIADGSAAGVSGTPSTFIIDSKGKSQIVVGAQPAEAFKTEIDKLLSNPS